MKRKIEEFKRDSLINFNFDYKKALLCCINHFKRKNKKCGDNMNISEKDKNVEKYKEDLFIDYYHNNNNIIPDIEEEILSIRARIKKQKMKYKNIRVNSIVSATESDGTREDIEIVNDVHL